MAHGKPAWFDQAAQLLAQGVPVAEVAAKVGTRRESLSRRLNNRDGELAQAVRALRTEQAKSPEGQERAALQDKARAILERAMDGKDPKLALDAAKVLLSKGGDAGAGGPADAAPPPIPSLEQALRELAQALAGIARGSALRQVAAPIVEELAGACSQLLAAVAEPAQVEPTAAQVVLLKGLN
jgi:hypothetical protein